MRVRLRSILIGSAAGVALAGGTFQYRNSSKPRNLQVVFLDVGQADSIVVRTPAGHTLLVDSGGRIGADDSGRKNIVPYLRGQGISHIDALLLTHPDDDHIGGAVTILERLAVDRLFVSALQSDSPEYAHVLATARKRDVSVVFLARGQTIDFHDSVVAEVLNPPDGKQPRTHHADNDGSLVVRIRRGKTSILLTGDAEEAAERDMERDGGDLSADVLKLGHHGSRTSTSPGFLAAVHPQVAIVSAGRHNRFGHPNPQVIDRLNAAHIRIYRTDEQGAITITSDGERITIHPERP